MLETEDLKSLATQATELNQLIQQVSRHTDQVRQHHGETRYLDLLTERVDLASRRTQELFDLITSRIITIPHGVPLGTPAPRSIMPAATPARTSVIIKIPVGEIGGSPGEFGEGEIQNPNGKRELILLVDDNEEILEGTGAILTFEDYRIVCAQDGPEALRIYRRMGAKISLVLLDYFLPVMDGDAVFDELKALNPNVQIVLSSGFDEQAKLGNMLARGLRGFLPKPYTHARLIEQIRAILDS